MRLIMYIVILISLVNAADYKDFPLARNSEVTWVLGARQKDSRLLWQSVHQFDLTHVAFIQFRKKSVNIGWANLNHRNYSCTSDMLQDAFNQAQKTKIRDTLTSEGKFQYLDIDYREINDTAWHCKKDIQNAFYKGYTKVYRVRGFPAGVIKDSVTKGPDVIFPEVLEYIPGRETVWYSTDRPVLYGYKPVGTSNKYSSPGPKGFYFKSSKDMEKDFPDFRYENDVFEVLPVTDCEVTEKGYWQVHIHPEEVWFPRNPLNGEPVKDPAVKLNPTAMSFDKALEMKKLSIANPDDARYTYYRNPYFDDSASTVMSVSFIDNSNPSDLIQNRSYIELTTGTEMIEGENKGALTHFPPRMVSFRSWDHMTTFTAMLKMFSEKDEDNISIDKMNNKCSDWMYTDIANGNIVCKTNEYGTLERIEDIPLDIWWYDDCPCTRIKELKNLTPVQLQRIVYKAFPTCSMQDISKYKIILKELGPYLTSEKDQVRIKTQQLLSEEILEKRIKSFSDDSSKVQLDLLERAAKVENVECEINWVRSW